MQVLQGKPQTSEELAARLGTSDRTIRRRLKVLPVITKKDHRRVIYSPKSPGATSVLPDRSNPEERDTESKHQNTPGNSANREEGSGTIRTQNRIAKIPESGHPFSVCVVGVLKAEPDRTFHVRDVVEKTGGLLDTVNRILSRLSKTGKGSGPVRKVSHGFYKYDPAKEQGNLIDFARSGEWKIENLRLVRMAARGASGQASQTVPDDPKQAEPPAQSGQETGTIRTPPKTSVPTPKFGYPWHLVNGQEVFWGVHGNGTEEIRISAKGKPPLSIDLVQKLLVDLKSAGADLDEWQCTSIEVNKDSRTRTFEGTFTMRVLENILIKAYDHDSAAARIEVANRQPIPMREVTDLFNYLQGGIEGKETLRKAEALEARVIRNEKDTALALTIARQVRDREHQGGPSGSTPKKPMPPAFHKGTEILKGKVTAGAEKREVKNHE
jgi:hypothetical protein